MIKIIILLAIVVLSGALGAAISTEKKRTVKVYTQFYEFNEKLLLNLKYGKEKIGVIAEEYAFVKRAMAGEEVLKGEDGEFLRSYLSGIGATDAFSQVEYLNERKAALQKHMQDSQDNYKKYGSLYFKLSLMTGILIAVLLA